MPRNHIWRAGLDASGFQSGARSVSRAAKSMSDQLKRSMDYGSLKSRVSAILGDGRAISTQIKAVTDANVEQARAQLDDLTRMSAAMKKMGTPDTNETYGRVQDAIQELRYDIQDYMTTLDDKTANERTSWRTTAEEAEKASTKAGRALRILTSPLRGVGNLLTRVVWPGIKKIGSGVGTLLTAPFRLLGKAVSGASTGFRRMLSAGMALTLVSAVMGRLRSIVSGYISENAALQAQVNGLKNAMGQALAPAINIVVNAMSALMPVVVGVSNAIGSLIGMLGGKWANAAAGANQYASAVGGAGSAQKKMNRDLMSFDEINKLSDNSSSGGGGGGGGSGSAAAEIIPSTPAWLERFKTTFTDLFSSDEFSAANIGGKLGMSLQAGLDWVANEFGSFDWGNVGAKLRENWDSFWNSGVVESFAHTVGVLLGGAMDLIGGFLHLDQLWAGLKQSFEEGGVKGVAAFVGGLISAATQQIGNFLFVRLLSPLFGGIADYFDQHGHSSIAGFFRGISDAMAAAPQWLKEHFFDPINNWIKKLFGIHSPSTVFAGYATNCVDGFLNKFSELKKKISDKLDSFKKIITDTATKIKDAFHFNWSLPRLKLPHLQVTWEPVGGFLSKFLGSTAVPHFGVQWYAKGGILDGAQIFGAMGNNLLGGGEAGREAVLPLDRNTGWMDDLARRVAVLLANSGGGDTTVRIPVILDGKQITEVVARNLRARARATGTAY